MKYIFFFSILCAMTSCDDGDIIITSFEFDDVSLEVCEGALPNEFVFFKINTTTNEAISYNFINEIYNETTVTETPIKINLENEDNAIVYRQFNTAITSDYYCSTIPDSSILITEELVSTSGQATIIVEIVDEDDSDGVIALNEDATATLEDEDINDDGNLENDDTDGDKIPNYKDQDDDNDNILTSVELPNNDINDDSYLDTDGDGIPNYLDNDDDNDGILSINEDIDNSGNPRDDDSDNDGLANYLDDDDDNDMIPTIDEDTNNNGDPRDDDTDMDGIPNYLDKNGFTDEAPLATGDLNPILDNIVSTTFRTTLTINDLFFDTASDQFTDENFSFEYYDVILPITK